MPPHSFLFGHLLVLQSVFKHVPADLNKLTYFGDIMERDFAEKGVYYIDLWPFSAPFLVITDLALAAQATQTNAKIACQRPPGLLPWFKPLAGGPNLFDLPEKEWKPWRSLFSQGFGAAQNLSLMPLMVEETLVFREKLRQEVDKGELFKLNPMCHRYVMDIMGRVVLNASLNAQKGWNALVDPMENQIAWHPTNNEADPIQKLNFVRPLVQWRNGRTMNRFVSQELDKRFEAHKAGKQDAKRKAVIDLILQAYLDDASASRDRLDDGFRTFAIRQIRLFAFVGQGSTSASIVYAIHLLSTHPAALAQLREEHDAVFGADPAAAAGRLSAEPHLVHRLRYTKAVIKETLRLFPAASGIRWGCAGADLVGPDGTRYPTGGTQILIPHPAVGRAARYWPEPDRFRPERWLVEPGHALHPPKGAWRPFEAGPRNCIGQDLVTVEMAVPLVLLMREFAFAPAYAEWDTAHPKKGLRTYRGDRAYQVESGSAHPSDGYPCRVALWKQES